MLYERTRDRATARGRPGRTILITAAALALLGAGTALAAQPIHHRAAAADRAPRCGAGRPDQPHSGQGRDETREPAACCWVRCRPA